MNLETLFGQTRAHWVRYSKYEYRQDEKSGQLFITPVTDAKVKGIYNPLKDSDTLVVDAINAGLVCMDRQSNEEQRKQAVLDFVNKYGLLGFMTALPTTPDFIDFGVVFLPKNQYIEESTMPCLDYIKLFYPFEKLDMGQNKNGFWWNVNNDTDMIALNLTMTNIPTAANMTYYRAYSEPYEWVRAELKDWAFLLLSSIFYYDETDETLKELYQKAMYAFGGIAPTYHIILDEGQPTIVWDYQSLMRVAQMALSYALTDKNRPLRICKGCTRAFIPHNSKTLYCTPQCKADHAEELKRKKE